MAKVLVTQSKLDTLAEVIGGKSNTQVPLTLDEMITAADSITSGGGTPNLQAKTYTVDSAGTETIEADEGYDGLSEVEVTVPQGNMAVNTESEYYTENNNRKWRFKGTAIIDSRDGDGQEGYIDDFTYLNGNYANYNAVPKNTTITPTTSSQTIGGANYMMEGAVTVSAMPSGTAGTPTASKSAVNNHAITVTPSVTNTAGYIAGGTINGTGVSVAASELVSGSQNITANDTYDVTNLASVVVNVQGGGSSMMVGTATATPSGANASISFTGLSGDPTSFAVVSSSDLATGAAPFKTAAVVYDGTNVIGQTITNTNNAQVSYDGTGFSKSYNNGNLTITGTNAYFQANEYKLVYTYGGTAGNINTDDLQVGSGATSISFTGLTDEPEYFSCIFKSNFATSSGYTRTIVVVYDGANTYGMEMGTGAQATAHWSYTYNAGTLTISSQSTTLGGYFHQPGYYQLTYAVGGDNTLQTKTVTPNTTTQNVTADTAQGYTALKKVVVNPIPSQYIVPTGNIAITSNGSGIDVSQYATASVSVSGGGGASVETKTVTASNRPSSLSFTSLKGTPIAWCLKATFTMTSSSSTYYYVDSMRYDGDNTQGRCFQMGSTRQTLHVTTGYSYSYNNGTLTVTSSGNRTTSPGCFYNGSYELVYVY